MTTFAVTDSDQILPALNYVLSNLGQGGNGAVTGNVLTVDINTGVISVNGSTTVQAYYYQYINIRYADDASGSGFSTSPTNKSYYGVLNSTATTPGNINNPASYQWFQATGGFGTTKFLYYSTLGGRQIQFTVATSAPVGGFVEVTDGSPINLDFVTATSTLPVIILNAYIRSATQPATPTGGTYNFTTLVLTPPTGWSASVPDVGTDPIWVITNTFESPIAGGSAGPSGPWSTPAVFGQEGPTGPTGPTGPSGPQGPTGASGINGVSTYYYNVFQSAASAPSTPTGGYYNFGTSTGTPPSGWSNTPTSIGGDPIWAVSAQVSSSNPTANVSIGSGWSSSFQYTGAGGAPGERGFVPMAYVLTPSTPIGASNTDLSQWFQAPTNGTPAGSNTAPVGTGFIPVTGDTAAFTFASNTAQVVVYTYSSSTSVWTPADGQVVNGNVIVTGSINSSRLNANDVYTIKLQSTNANIGNNSSNGFWFDSTTGNARIAGNTSIGSNLSIGNNLSVANNASIGGNLSISGLVFSGNLIANTVTSTTIANGAVTYGKLAADSVQANAISANSISGNIIIANTLSGNSIIANTINGNSIIANTINGNSIIANTIAGNTLIANTITATQISTAYLYTGNLTSLNGEQGNISSPGYWMDYTSGNARFGGNVWIGANLNVSGLVTAGGLNANTVATTTMQPNSVSNYGAVSYSSLVTVSSNVTIPGAYYITDTAISITASENNQNTFIWAALQPTFNMSGISAGESFDIQISLLRADWPSGANQTIISYESYTLGGLPATTLTSQFVGFHDNLPTAGNSYVYAMQIYVYNQVGTFTISSILAGPRSMLLQSIKR